MDDPTSVGFWGWVKVRMLAIASGMKNCSRAGEASQRSVSSTTW